ncbi:MAG: hypothetical protein V1779_02905 [bacterium]
MIDTSIMYDALLINYSFTNKKNDSISNFANYIFDNNKIYKKNYIEFLENIGRFITTSHAIGELQGLINSRTKIHDNLKSSFWKISISYLRKKQIDETLIRILPLSDINSYTNFIYKIGYIDTGLIELAKKENIPIVTQDFKTLASIARSQGIQVFVPEESLKYL